MKYGVFLSSAVNSTLMRVYTPEERLQQTIKSIETIRERIPNSVIVMFDCSIPGVDDATKKMLSGKVDYFIDFSKDTLINNIPQMINHKDTVMNLSELVAISKTFKIIKDNNWFEGCDRIFKMSARYWLNEKFDISVYEKDSVKGKYVFTKKMLSQFPKSLVGQSLQYMLRVYSFDGSLIDDYMQKIKMMIDDVQNKIVNNQYIDVEHLFYKFVPQDNIFEIARSGITGNISKTGALIEN